MPSELAKELSLSTPTVLEHLGKLEQASLVRREETGHKWIYYSLTTRGSSIVRPKVPANFVLVLSITVMLVSVGVFFTMYLTDLPQGRSNDMAAGGGLESAPMALTITNEDYGTEQKMVVNETNMTNVTIPLEAP